MKNIRQRRVDMRTLKLSPEEGFVLSRVDGATSVRELVALTGLDEGRVVEIVGRLSREGALEIGDGGPTTSSATSPPAAVESELLAFLQGAGQGADAGASDDAACAELEEVEELAELEEVVDVEAAVEADAASAHRNRADADEPPVEDAPPLPISEPSLEAAADAATEAEVVASEQLNEREYRKIYATVYQPMSKDQRIVATLDAQNSHLMALCFDPDPQVIHGVLHNSHAGLEQARMIALHHRTHVGLETVAKRSDHLKDALVQRRLLRNPQLPVTILQRMVNPKMLLEIYKLAVDRELPERSRMMTREILRKKFMLASSDERAALLFKTEGRCLILLLNCSLDAHATQILCSKSNYTMLFIQNLARWSATPPPLLAHLLKNPVVRRNLGMKKMLLKHPNMPSEAKRNAGM